MYRDVPFFVDNAALTAALACSNFQVIGASSMQFGTGMIVCVVVSA